MPRSLLIAVRFCDGRYHGRDDGFDGSNGWPPSPGRLFQALVAASAEGASIPASDVRALRWLETLEPPRIAAPQVRRGRAVNQYVPNNDLDSKGGDPARVGDVRVSKHWQPCFFDAEQPVLYAWDFDTGMEEARRVSTIAARLYHLGRGIDMAWASGEVLERVEAESILDAHPGTIRQPNGAGHIATAGRGTLDSLLDRYQGKRHRLRTSVGKDRKPLQEFRQPPKARFRRTGYDCSPRCLHFELRHPKGTFAPRPLSSVAPLIVGLRDAAAKRLQEALPDQFQLFEKLIVGRGAKPVDLGLRIRFIPVPSVGKIHTDPSIRRILVEIPADCPIRVDDLNWALSGLEPRDPETGELWPGRLVSTDDARMHQHFVGPAREFKSVTPLALPTIRRRIDPARIADDAKAGTERADEERCAAGAVVQALRHAGISASPKDVRVQREPFHLRGEHAEHFAPGTRFPKERLWHASVTFQELVVGPLLLGDGRFLGLGLMSPKMRNPDLLAFSIKSGLVETASPGAVARAARRAMMARMQASLPRGEKLPCYVSGHSEDGGPARGGDHRHIAIFADLPRQRILYVAPTVVQRHGVTWRDIAGAQRQVVRALEDMRVLYAGDAGRLLLEITILERQTDPLFAPSLVWDSITDYRVTRHHRRLADEDALKLDVHAELRRVGWPLPCATEVHAARRGPRGGISGRLRLTFATAQAGPLAIGRTSHQGGGLFAIAD